MSRTPTAPRKAAAPGPSTITPDVALRLAATTALSRIMRGDTDGARELLAGLPPAALAEIARAATDLSGAAADTQSQGAA